MQTVPEKEQNLWVAIAAVFNDTSATRAREMLRAEGVTSLEEIRRTFFTIVAPGMSLLRVTNKGRQEPFSRQEIIEVCFQFYRPRCIRPLVQLFGRYICRKAGGVTTRWEALEQEFFRQAAQK